MRRLACLLLPALFTLMLVSIPRVASALAEETFGDQPIHETNYKEWPGVFPAVNHESRVYGVWVNGHETLYYTGNTAALNTTLLRLAAAGELKSQVVLRPGPKKVSTFKGDKTFDVNWDIDLMGGISRHLTTRDKGDLVWSKDPVLTIYTGGQIDLAKLQIPQGLRVTRISELKRRTKEGLTSKDQTVRGWGCGVLAGLDPYDMETVKTLTGMLADPVDWVRLNAVGSLETFGKKAEAALPALKMNLDSKDKNLKESAAKTIATIEAAQDNQAAEKAFNDSVAAIEKYLSSRKVSPHG